jgi:hypothetical protein
MYWWHPNTEIKKEYNLKVTFYDLKVVDYKLKIITMIEKSLLPDEMIMNKIYYIRGQKVMLDKDLAELYSVQTGHLNRVVIRNIKRFPEDFMFQLDGIIHHDVDGHCPGRHGPAGTIIWY